MVAVTVEFNQSVTMHYFPLTFPKYSWHPAKKGNQIHGYSVTKQALREHTLLPWRLQSLQFQVGQKSIHTPAGATVQLPFYVPILFLPQQKYKKRF